MSAHFGLPVKTASKLIATLYSANWLDCRSSFNNPSHNSMLAKLLFLQEFDLIRTCARHVHGPEWNAQRFSMCTCSLYQKGGEMAHAVTHTNAMCSHKCHVCTHSPHVYRLLHHHGGTGNGNGTVGFAPLFRLSRESFSGCCQIRQLHCVNWKLKQKGKEQNKGQTKSPGWHCHGIVQSFSPNCIMLHLASILQGAVTNYLIYLQPPSPAKHLALSHKP